MKAVRITLYFIDGTVEELWHDDVDFHKNEFSSKIVSLISNNKTICHCSEDNETHLIIDYSKVKSVKIEFDSVRLKNKYDILFSEENN